MIKFRCSCTTFLSMQGSLLFCILFLSCLIGSAQKNETDPFTTTSIDQNTDDIGFIGESLKRVYHFDVLKEYGISEKFGMQLQAIYERTVAGGTYHFPFVGKYYVTEKGYLLGGPAVDFYLNEVLGQVMPTRLSRVIGAGYDVKENFFLQVQGDFKIKGFNKGFDVAPRPNTLTLTSGLKF